MLTRSHLELIEMPQRMGASRKSAADIKMAVDAVAMVFERDYISTFAICTGDSDFTSLVHKLRELNKRAIGVGVEQSPSAMLPPARPRAVHRRRHQDRTWRCHSAVRPGGAWVAGCTIGPGGQPGNQRLAKSKKIDASDRGRIKQEIVDRYHAEAGR